MVTDTARPLHTHRQDRLQYTAPQLASAQCNKKSLTVPHIDFKNAFDTVSYEKLFARLYSYGTRDTVLSWIKNFFTNRTHQTRIGWSLSAVADLLSGVGPVCFLIYIDDLAKVPERNDFLAIFCR